MNQQQSDYLIRCNCLICGTLPAEKRGEHFYTPDGMMVPIPNDWRFATHEEIIQLMESNKHVPIMGPFGWGVEQNRESV